MSEKNTFQAARNTPHWGLSLVLDNHEVSNFLSCLHVCYAKCAFCGNGPSTSPFSLIGRPMGSPTRYIQIQIHLRVTPKNVGPNSCKCVPPNVLMPNSWEHVNYLKFVENMFPLPHWLKTCQHWSSIPVSPPTQNQNFGTRIWKYGNHKKRNDQTQHPSCPKC